MAQLRQDYNQFIERDSIILAVGPDDKSAFQKFWSSHNIPFIGIPDPDHIVADLYGQQVSLLRFGRMPALVVIDKAGRIQYRHFANSMHDIPSNRSILAVLDKINQDEKIKYTG
jgi:peroxiredoxin Q/BCP